MNPTKGQIAYEAYRASFVAGLQPAEWSSLEISEQVRWEIAGAAAAKRLPRKLQAPLPFFYFFNGKKIERVQLADRRTRRWGRKLVKRDDGSTSPVSWSRLKATQKLAIKAEVQTARERVAREKACLREAERRLARALKLK